MVVASLWTAAVKSVVVVVAAAETVVVAAVVVVAVGVAAVAVAVNAVAAVVRVVWEEEVVALVRVNELMIAAVALLDGSKEVTTDVEEGDSHQQAPLGELSVTPASVR